ncbi:TerC family protein [Bacteroides sp. 519]|uniref:TerC family protein n=1 Tax=Bacteroides sp. 519 TaxID=2302937 RepID=UPI0013D6292B|nr:TerC family protein [Bacteroides sp. 519]NDV57384.1 TerC family protein [Bacteroides sp. 519]
MEILHTFLLPSAWIALLTLTLLEVVLGIDNVVFLSIMSSKLPENQQGKAQNTGLFLAMLARIALLFGISLLMQLTKPFYSFDAHWITGGVTGQSLIVLVGGLFLLYKSVSEIHDKLEGTSENKSTKKKVSFWGIIGQIVALDIVFSFDSVLTAVGMVSFRDFGYVGAMAIMVTAIVASVVIMMWFLKPISNFVGKHPTVQMLALSFLILIAVMLLVEAAHLSNIVIFGNAIQEIPKGYIYFAIGFALLVEYLNLRARKKKK